MDFDKRLVDLRRARVGVTQLIQTFVRTARTMMPAKKPLVALIVLSVCFASSDSAKADQGGRTKLAPGSQFAARIEGVLQSLQQTKYQHTTKIDAAQGFVYCDCSGLIGFFLREEFPEAYLSVKGDEAPWRKRPLAVTYYQTFVSAGSKTDGSWKRVTKLADAVPGDILAWRKEDLKAGSTTGHVCMIASRPEKVGDGKIRVRVIDSTRSPHDSDTRSEGKDGLGTGYKTFLVDANGKPIGYTKGERELKKTMAVGRIVKAKAATTHEADADFIGLTAAKAIEVAKQRGHVSRIIRQDGNPKPVVWNINDDRVNFVIKDDHVTQVVRG